MANCSVSFIFLVSNVPLFVRRSPWLPYFRRPGRDTHVFINGARLPHEAAQHGALLAASAAVSSTGPPATLHDAVLAALEAAVVGGAAPLPSPRHGHMPLQEVFVLLPEDSVPVKPFPVLRERLCGAAYASLQCLRGQHDTAAPAAALNNTGRGTEKRAVEPVSLPASASVPAAGESKTALSWLAALFGGGKRPQRRGRRRLLHDAAHPSPWISPSPSHPSRRLLHDAAHPSLPAASAVSRAPLAPVPSALVASLGVITLRGDEARALVAAWRGGKDDTVTTDFRTSVSAGRGGKGKVRGKAPRGDENGGGEGMAAHTGWDCGALIYDHAESNGTAAAASISGAAWQALLTHGGSGSGTGGAGTGAQRRHRGNHTTPHGAPGDTPAVHGLAPAPAPALAPPPAAALLAALSATSYAGEDAHTGAPFGLEMRPPHCSLFISRHAKPPFSRRPHSRTADPRCPLSVRGAEPALRPGPALTPTTRRSRGCQHEQQRCQPQQYERSNPHCECFECYAKLKQIS